MDNLFVFMYVYFCLLRLSIVLSVHIWLFFLMMLQVITITINFHFSSNNFSCIFYGVHFCSPPLFFVLLFLSPSLCRWSSTKVMKRWWSKFRMQYQTPPPALITHSGPASSTYPLWITASVV